MNAASLFAWWGLFTWVPRFLSLPVAEGGRGLGIVMTSEWTIVMQAGTFLGYISFGYFADRFSHKYTYIAYLFLAALMVPVFAFVQNSSAVILAGALVGFFGTGYFSGFAIIASELFPTALRASGFSADRSGFSSHHNFRSVLDCRAHCDSPTASPFADRGDWRLNRPTLYRD
jgi:MFS family permease